MYVFVASKRVVAGPYAARLQLAGVVEPERKDGKEDSETEQECGDGKTKQEGGTNMKMTKKGKAGGKNTRATVVVRETACQHGRQTPGRRKRQIGRTKKTGKYRNVKKEKTANRVKLFSVPVVKQKKVEGISSELSPGKKDTEWRRNPRKDSKSFLMEKIHPTLEGIANRMKNI